MCIPAGKQRKNQKKTLTQVPTTDPLVLETQCKQPQQVKVRPKLISLTVTDATDLGNGVYWAVKQPGQNVGIRAVTSPDDASGWGEVDWEGASAVLGGKRDATVDRAAVKNFTVTASLDDVSLEVKIEIYDLVSLDCALPTSLGPLKWKAYASDQRTRMTAVTAPNEAKVWNLLSWSEGSPASDNNGRDVDLKPVGDRDVTVKLGAKPLVGKLHLCQWPTLKIKTVKFTAQEVLNDGEGTLDQVFDNTWKRNRPAHSAKAKATDCQSPICYVAKSKVRLEATFEVVDKATDDESVKIEADLGFGKIAGTVAVKAGAATADLAATDSDKPLPKEVDANPAWAIAWHGIAVDGNTWLDAGSSTHPLYVLLGAPTQKLYLTLLDISCVAARGKSTENDFVTETFKPFAAAKGNGKGFVRKGDGVSMSYYNKGSKTATGNDVQTTAGMLGSHEGTGRCGGWATLLLHVWGMHGVVSGKRRWFIRAFEQSLLNFDLRFLVKNCDFTALGTLAQGPYTHHGDPVGKKEVEKKAGIPGHGQDNPQFDFGDHVVVKHNGILYDPSYGVSGYTTDDAYLSAALDGLGRWPRHDYEFPKGLDQHIPKECIPYADGFAEYTIILEPFEWLAKSYGVDGATLFPHCEVYDSAITLLKLSGPKKVKPGYLVVVKTSSGDNEHEMVRKVTLADIAGRHGKTEDEIFDHPKNATLKALRKTKDQLRTGDTVVVPRDLVADAWRVVGHDL